MMLWFDFWRSFWSQAAAPAPPPSPLETRRQCNLDELAEALQAYIASAKDVAAGAARNVEDAERILTALQIMISAKSQALDRSKTIN